MKSLISNLTYEIIRVSVFWVVFKMCFWKKQVSHKKRLEKLNNNFEETSNPPNYHIIILKIQVCHIHCGILVFSKLCIVAYFFFFLKKTHVAYLFFSKLVLSKLWHTCFYIRIITSSISLEYISAGHVEFIIT